MEWAAKERRPSRHTAHLLYHSHKTVAAVAVSVSDWTRAMAMARGWPASSTRLA